MIPFVIGMSTVIIITVGSTDGHLRDPTTTVRIIIESSAENNQPYNEYLKIRFEQHEYIASRYPAVITENYVDS